MDHQIIKTNSGLRVLWVPCDSPIAHACLIIGAGAQHEGTNEFGMAHFLEHLLFKQTERRNTTQILNRLELVGADLNAYTTKEYTCLHASFLRPHLTRTLDLFEDLVFHSVFPEKEIEKEREIVIDEIASYQDAPEEAIGDDFEDLLFEGHAFGHNILGDKSSLLKMDRKALQQFVSRHYQPENMTLAVSGPYSLKHLARLCEKIFLNTGPFSARPVGRSPKWFYTPRSRTQGKHMAQAHYMTGNIAYSLHDSRKYGLMLLNNLLGGIGMSSRLNLQLREKHGIAYTVESNYTPYTDTGIFSVYFGTEAEKIQRGKHIMHRELKQLREKKLGSIQLHQAKQKFIGQIALAEENRMGVLISMAKNLMDYGRVNTLEHVVSQLQMVTAEGMLEISNEVFEPEQLSTLLFYPENE